MKKLVFLSFLLLCFGDVYGQQDDWKPIYSDELHFTASFPKEPQESTGDIEMSFGKGTSRRWVSEFPGITYEILVADFSQLGRKLEGKELHSFYSGVCIDLGGTVRECRGFAGYNLFGEEGVTGEFRTGAGTVVFEMFLTGTRLYVAKVEADKSVERQVREDRKKFLDEFNFVHVDEKKLKSGLPKSASENNKDK